MARTLSKSGHVEFAFSDQLRADFEPSLGALWLRWNPKPRACFNLPLLAALDDYCAWLSASNGELTHDGNSYRVNASILTSDAPGIFNLGGDLDLFSSLIDHRDRDGLIKYGSACVEVVYRNFVSYDLPIMTISLVQGECLGGGFEAALSSQIVIAERSARFGFPEIMFNLFPGMGAVSFVLRRTNERVAEELTSSAKIYSADELQEKGVVDIVVSDGEGPAAVRDYLGRKAGVMQHIFQVRKKVWRLKRSELDDIVGIWVDCALRINPRDLKLMGHLVARQNRIR